MKTADLYPLNKLLWSLVFTNYASWNEPLDLGVTDLTADYYSMSDVLKLLG